MAIKKNWTGHCPCGITVVALPLASFFMQLLPLLVFSVLILILGTFSENFWYQIQATSVSKWNYHTVPIVKLPLAGRDSASVPQPFAFFATSFSILSNNIYIYNTLRQLLVPNSSTINNQNPELGTVPLELPYWKCPWPRGAVLPCPGIFYFSGIDMST